jgi:hypothetical protein
LLIASVAVAALVFLAERLLEPGVGGALTITLAFFLGLAEGAIVLMAGAEISDGHWHRQLPSHGRRTAVRHSREHAAVPGQHSAVRDVPVVGASGRVGSTTPFFIARNLVMMLVMFVLCRVFMRNALRGSSSTNFWGVVLVIAFVWHLDHDRHRMVHVDREAVVLDLVRRVLHGKRIPLRHLHHRALHLRLAQAHRTRPPN